MRVITVLCAWTLVGCASLGAGAGRESVSRTVDVPVDTALRIARTQLQLHNYKVGSAGGSTLVTEPRAVPGEVRDAANRQEAEYWVVRIDVGRRTFGGTEVKVRGFRLPDGRPTVPGSQPKMVPVTDSDRRLFNEIETIATWISDAAQRKMVAEGQT
ncbi:MAG TPA: hypothetical protein VFB46_14025 [Gemmatimonadaceae bacterium]|nr:hypothetical protein [Gemmatimonadaceae bacterium]